MRKFLHRQTQWVNQVTARQAVNLGGLSPREKVIQQYQFLPELCEKFAMGRKQSVTPLKYAVFLNSILPEEVHPNINEINGEFMEARYSNHDITDQSPVRIKRNFGKIQKIINRRDRAKNKSKGK